MAEVGSVSRQEEAQPRRADRVLGSLRFDWLIVALGLWMAGGMHLDAWAHHSVEVETFFTPWHAVLYSGFLALASMIGGYWVRNLARGYRWESALPVGYGLSLVGVAIFSAGAVGDLVWHGALGIEDNLEALLSPTHLLLGFGGSLIIMGPLRAAWARTETVWKVTPLLPGYFLSRFSSPCSPSSLPSRACSLKPSWW